MTATSTQATSPRVTVGRIGGLLLAALGTGGLLALTLWIGQQQAQDLSRYFLYQGATLLLALVVVAGVWALNGRNTLRWGSLAAGSRRMALLGVKAGESWRRVGITFTIIISAVTALFLTLTFGNQFGSVASSSWLLALAAAIPLSASNALVEELITRWAVAQSLTGQAARFAPWASALLFGSVHYFGTPGGLVGSLMAGFLAWLLTRSIQDIRGIGWAWIVHFCQDVLIFTVTLAIFL